MHEYLREKSMSSPVALFTDPLFLRHETGPHVETPRRLTRVLARLEQSGLAALCRPGTYVPATEEQLCRAHDPVVALRAKAVAEQGGGYLDSDTVVCPESYVVAKAAAGACMAAVDDVLYGPQKRALCLVRPPGHHATPTHSMGFCLFNNIALAAQRARDEHGLSKILIVDWDVHHGNGTQDIFFADGGVGFLSIHRYGHGFYPGTGAADETGSGPGLGCIRNVPVAYGTSRTNYLEGFKSEVARLADEIKPELILVSAGFDAHAADPIGSLGLDTDDFRETTRFLLDVADVHAGGRLVSCLEGGYNLDALAESVSVHLEELLRYRIG
jgi:acetoin utilization deacetylase AcuC-like enzyme